MNEHEKVNSVLVDFALDELSYEAQAEVKTHVARCAQCSAELKRIKALLEHAGRMGGLSADDRTCESAERAVLEAVQNQNIGQRISGLSVSLEFIRRTIMKNKRIELAAAAAIVIIVLGGVTFWPGGTLENGQWWLGSPAAWGREIIVELGKVEALVSREQTVFVGRYGSTHVGSRSKSYEAKDRSRRDNYHFEHTDEDTFGDSNEAGVLQHVTWSVPDGKDLVSYEVSFEFQCYSIKRTKGGAHERDPMKELRFYVSLLDKADRVLDAAVLDGRECVGFEIDASKYGDNPKGRVDRIWFDVKTKLPVRIEKHGRPVTDQPGRTFTFIQDRFEYYAQIPAEMFEPRIPEGFINAERHELQSAREEQEKAQMIYADVPPGLKDEIAAALNNVKTAVYRKRDEFVRDGKWTSDYGTKVYLSLNCWRKDYYSGERLNHTDWFVVGKDDWGKTSFDFNDRNFKLTQTTVIPAGESYSIVTHDSKSHPDNPMDRIIWLASWVDRADRFLENEKIGGVECLGFELSAKKYGTNPDGMLHRIWFDAETKLPVRMEFEWLDDDGPKKEVKDQFQWNPELAAETFTPVIPEGFINAHPDEIQAASERQQKE